MSIKLRLTLLLGLLLLGFLGTLAVLRVLENRAMAQLAAEDRRARTQLLEHWIDFTNRALPQAASDLAQSDDFAAALASAAPANAAQKIQAYLAQSGIDELWVIGADGRPRGRFVAEGEARRPAAAPLEGRDFLTLASETPNARFFARDAVGLIEVAVRRLAAANRGERDWLMATRRWDPAQLRALAALTDGSVTLAGPGEIADPPTGADVVVTRPLADWQGHPLQTLVVTHHAAEIDRAVSDDWRQAGIFTAFGLLVLTALGLAVHQWVLRPLDRIGASLARNDPAPVQPLAREGTELGRVAQLVLTSFEQREAVERALASLSTTHAALERSEATLRRTLEERARLGRDLHDGVIQSLYAAGMGLAGIRALLRDEQVEAAARLEQTRAALNETIHDVRNFIIGLEPEALKLLTFSQAVGALLETMRGIRPFESTIDIDESLAARLSLAQRVHALQITREAVSNSLRHGSANVIHVTLRSVSGYAEFTVHDDGSGFDAAEAPGQGLRNLAQRARELGAQLTIDSERGHGTRVKLTFSFHL